MILCTLDSLSKSFAGKELFNNLSFTIFERDRIGLIGLNGSGKSSLMKIIAGIDKPDSGSLSLRKGLRVGYLPQTSEFEEKLPFDILMESLKADSETPDYEKEVRVKTILSKLGFTNLEITANLLSGGWKKRLRLGIELLKNPDLLLLDEPTNHLDLDGIEWLEKFLKTESLTYLLVSHDRYFLNHATTRIIELDKTYPAGFFSVDAPYTEFLRLKSEFLEGQIQREASLASKARREEAWLQSNVKARTTKSESRIKEAHELLDELSDIQKRNQQKSAGIDFISSERSTRKLIVAKNISLSFGGKNLFKNLDFTLSPGTRIGLMGSNGSGKTTLLRVIADEIEVELGTIKRADDLKVVYFDQHRVKLPDHLTLRQALSPTGDFVKFQGKEIHVNGWCRRFLFSVNQLDLPISILSGGERARISIANLMLKPADILLLDEPTNDLDIQTLETLEESLLTFPGAIVLITHDRCMLDRVCNLFLPLGDPSNKEIFAEYSQWVSYKQKKEIPPQKESKSVSKTKTKPKSPSKEIKQVENKITKLEEELKELTKTLEDPSIAKDTAKLNELCKKIGLQETKIEALYLEWESLQNPS
jgi:ATP-binding cassette subfamily F protein uup